MKIALIGLGNTGREIEKVIQNSSTHILVSVSTKHTGFDEKGLAEADVVIDFSSPDAVVGNIETVAKMSKNMVIGTSGWYDQLEKITEIVQNNDIGLIYGQSFSIGTNVFFKIVEYASKLFSEVEGVDVYGLEIHHKGKKDSPSGTALKIASQIMHNFPAKTKLQTDKLDRQIEASELHFASVRGGLNPGMHQVVFDSEGESIKLEVQSHSRVAYAKGAVMAAEYIQGKKGVYSFDELFK